MAVNPQDQHFSADLTPAHDIVRKGEKDYE